jgi:hypothetical protein
MSWEDTCGVCGNDNPALWWMSRLTFKVCMRCVALVSKGMAKVEGSQ